MNKIFLAARSAANSEREKRPSKNRERAKLARYNIHDLLHSEFSGASVSCNIDISIVEYIIQCDLELTFVSL